MELTVFVNILFVAFSGASLANFFDDCLQDGMIFCKYGNFINTNKRWYFKPLGGCIICTNFWITILLVALFIFSFKAFIFFSVVGISNTFLKFIIK